MIIVIMTRQLLEVPKMAALAIFKAFIKVRYGHP